MAAFATDGAAVAQNPEFVTRLANGYGATGSLSSSGQRQFDLRALGQISDITAAAKR
jgi:hypothetical protein